MAVRWKDQRDESDDEQGLPPDVKDAASGKNRFAVALGRLGGLKGGKARARKLSARRRREIARKAANARWRKERTTSRKKER